MTLLNGREAALALRLSERTLERLRLRGDGPSLSVPDGSCRQRCLWLAINPDASHDVIGPTLKSVAHLFGVGAVIVGPSHASLVPASVIEDGLDHMRRNAQVAQACSACPPEVVDSPGRKGQAAI
jgi:hypothetical protein